MKEKRKRKKRERSVRSTANHIHATQARARARESSEEKRGRKRKESDRKSENRSGRGVKSGSKECREIRTRAEAEWSGQEAVLGRLEAVVAWASYPRSTVARRGATRAVAAVLWVGREALVAGTTRRSTSDTGATITISWAVRTTPATRTSPVP